LFSCNGGSVADGIVCRQHRRVKKRNPGLKKEVLVPEKKVLVSESPLSCEVLLGTRGQRSDLDSERITIFEPDYVLVPIVVVSERLAETYVERIMEADPRLSSHPMRQVTLG
jgi:hypothetical protein